MFSLKERVHGSEDPLLFRWQQGLGNYIATTGRDHIVKIWDRHGNMEEEMHLPGYFLNCFQNLRNNLKTNIVSSCLILFYFNYNFDILFLLVFCNTTLVIAVQCELSSMSVNKTTPLKYRAYIYCMLDQISIVIWCRITDINKTFKKIVHITDRMLKYICGLCKMRRENVC